MSRITLNWSDPGDATITFYEYQQKAGLAPFGPWTLIPGSSAATASYRLAGLDNGTAYVYRIRAGRGADISLASDAVTVTPQGAPPAAPVLTATPRSGGVVLSWPNPVDLTIQEYEYQYKSRRRDLWAVAARYGRWPAEDCRNQGVYQPFCAPPLPAIPAAPPWQVCVGRPDQRHGAYVPYPGGERRRHHALERGVRHAGGRGAAQAHGPDGQVGLRVQPQLASGAYLGPCLRTQASCGTSSPSDEGRTWAFLQLYPARHPFGITGRLRRGRIPLLGIRLSRTHGQRRGAGPGLRAGRR